MGEDEPPEVHMVESRTKGLTLGEAVDLHNIGIDVIPDADARRRGVRALLVSLLRLIRTGNLFISSAQTPKEPPTKK